MSNRKKLPALGLNFSLELTPEMLAKIEQLVEDCVEKKLPEVVRKCLNEPDLEKIIEEKVREILGAEEAEIELKVIPREEAIKKIKSYIDTHPDCLTGDIIYDLGLDPDLVLSVLDELKKKGLIRGVPIE
jgi:hypothetical protein